MSTADIARIEEQEQRRARPRIERSDRGYEITLSSEFDESILYFVSYAASKRWAPKSTARTSAPEEPGDFASEAERPNPNPSSGSSSFTKKLLSVPKKEVDEKEAQRPKRERKSKEA